MRSPLARTLTLVITAKTMIVGAEKTDKPIEYDHSNRSLLLLVDVVSLYRTGGFPSEKPTFEYI